MSEYDLSDAVTENCCRGTVQKLCTKVMFTSSSYWTELFSCAVIVISFVTLLRDEMVDRPFSLHIYYM